jgi:hypothetical protein
MSDGKHMKRCLTSEEVQQVIAILDGPQKVIEDEAIEK